MEDITDADYVHIKRVCKGFEKKNLGEYHNLYVQMYLRIFEMCVLKYMNLTLLVFLLNKDKHGKQP